MPSRRGATRRSRLEEFVGARERRNSSGTGILTGVVLGAGIWAVILSMIKC